MIGVWLSKKERDSLEEKEGSPKANLAAYFLAAHDQLIFGGIMLLLGFCMKILSILANLLRW